MTQPIEQRNGTMAKFETGCTYSQRYASNYDRFATFRVDRRTEKSVWLTEIYGNGSEENLGRKSIKTHNGVERVKPHGSYAMCFVLEADNPDQKTAHEKLRARAKMKA